MRSFFRHVFLLSLAVSRLGQATASSSESPLNISKHLSYSYLLSSLQVPDAQPSTVAVFAESAVKTFRKQFLGVSATSTESAPLFQLHQDLDVLPTHLCLEIAEENVYLLHVY